MIIVFGGGINMFGFGIFWVLGFGYVYIVVWNVFIGLFLVS